MRENSRVILTQFLVAAAMAAEQAKAGKQGVLVDQELVDLQRGLTTSTLKLTDCSIYSTKDASSSRLVRLFETSDVEEEGITNVTAAKLQRNQLVLVDRIRLMAANASAAINGSAAVLSALKYEGIRNHGGLVGGSITIRQSNKNVLYQLSLRNFDTTGRLDRKTGEYFLSSPILLRPQQLIEANLDLGKALPDRQAVRIELLGTQTSPF